MITFYTNNLIPKGAAACARGPFIFICPEYRGDVGLLAHIALLIAPVNSLNT